MNFLFLQLNLLYDAPKIRPEVTYASKIRPEVTYASKFRPEVVWCFVSFCCCSPCSLTHHSTVAP